MPHTAIAIEKHELTRDHSLNEELSELAKLNTEIARAARSRHSVLVTGESGTGKTTAAAKIHAGSARAQGPLIVINCAAIPEALLEAELFGYEKGAFTGAVGLKKGLFETAEGGTLFLDEIGEMAPAMQPKLLKAIEEKTIRRLGSTRDIQCDVRVIAATSQNLLEMIKQGMFRGDLFYRLAVLEVHTAPLRDRRSDIPELISHRLKEEQKLSGRESQFEIEVAAVERLCAYYWPGNIRQLHNIVARLTSFVDGDAPITVEDVLRCLPTDTADNSANSTDKTRPLPASVEDATESNKAQDGRITLCEDVHSLEPGESLEDYLLRVTQVAIETTVQKLNGFGPAAERLGVHRETLRQRLRRVVQRSGQQELAA
jgi:two-component system, NtrC family, response regulator PilR